MKDYKNLKVSVKRSMRPKEYEGELLDANPMPALEVSPNPEVLHRVRSKIYKYQQEYRNKPTHVLLTPHEYLCLFAHLRMVQSFEAASLQDQIIIEGVSVIPVSEGVSVNLKDLTHVAWKLAKKWS